MRYRTLAIIAVISLLLGVAVGRYSSRTPAAQSQTSVKTKQDIVTDTRTVIVKEPNGKQTTVITQESRTKSSENLSSREKTARSGPTVNVSVLAGIDVRTRAPVYGISASKEMIGPITIGAFGLTSGVVGVSVGLNF